MRPIYAILAILALLVALAVPASAYIEGDLRDIPGPSINGILGYTVYGNQMAGMTVQATFEGGREDNLVWLDLGGTTGGVVGDGWSLKVTGDTFNDNAWILTNNTGSRLTQLIIDPLTGGVVFDAIYDPNNIPHWIDYDSRPFNTPNSGRGKFANPGSMAWDDTTLGYSFFVMYSRIIDIIGHPYSPYRSAYGDLYGWLRIQFAPGFNSGESISWSCDTDFTSDTVINPIPDIIKGGLEESPVPLPATVLLLLLDN